MKTTGLLLSFLVLLFACTNPQENNASHNHQSESKPAPGLSLNNGQKWKADKSTLESVREMQGIYKRFEMDGAADRAHLAAELDRVTENLIQGCTMTGPDHDALHEWLHPFMKQVENLSSPDNHIASEAVTETGKSLKDFDAYFE